MTVRVATCYLSSRSPYSQSRLHETPKTDKERPDDYEKRTWRNKMHVTKDGRVYIPQMALKNCLAEAAKYLSLQIQGKGKSTYTKHFEAGVVIADPIVLDVKANDVQEEALWMNADGVRGSGKRVKRIFPHIENWKAVASVMVIDSTITEEVFEKHLKEAGSFIGVGRFRPRNNGFYGRFGVDKIKWSKYEE